MNEKPISNAKTLPIASKENNYYYNIDLLLFAKSNRKTFTKSAACMWKYVLSKNRMLGYQFRREFPILNYIADFACLELLLIIEVDGITHETNEAYIKDQRKDEKLKEIGFTVLRFGSWEVLNRIHEVNEKIENWINENAIAPPRERKKRDK